MLWEGERDGNIGEAEKFTDFEEISMKPLFLRFWNLVGGKEIERGLTQMLSPTPRSPIVIGIRIKGFGDGAGIKSGFLLVKACELSGCGSFLG